MDNTEAIEKLAGIAETAYDNINDIDVTQSDICEGIAEAILAAILDDPMAYGIKPKPLVWDGFVSGAYRIEVLSSGIANLWFYDAREVEEGEPELLKGGYLTLINMDELKAAANEHNCAKFAAMIGEPQ